MQTLIGAALGAVLVALWPLATLAVTVCAPFCRKAEDWPYWLITPDDPFLLGEASHWGEYEPTVRKVYSRFGRIIGDIYWLGWRNVLYGLRYQLKPKSLLPQPPDMNYAHLHTSVHKYGPLYVWMVERYGMLELSMGKIKLIAGWKVDRMVDDKLGRREAINMDARPVFSLRRA